MKYVISYGYTVCGPDGNYGTWWASTDDGERVEGTWKIGSWEVHSNTTPLSDDVWDEILDNNDFWQGPTDETIDGAYHVGEWDGETFTVL